MTVEEIINALKDATTEQLDTLFYETCKQCEAIDKKRHKCYFCMGSGKQHTSFHNYIHQRTTELAEQIAGSERQSHERCYHEGDY